MILYCWGIYTELTQAHFSQKLHTEGAIPIPYALAPALKTKLCAIYFFNLNFSVFGFHILPIYNCLCSSLTFLCHLNFSPCHTAHVLFKILWRYQNVLSVPSPPSSQLKHYLVFQFVIRKIHAYSSAISLEVFKILVLLNSFLKVKVHLNFTHKFV